MHTVSVQKTLAGPQLRARLRRWIGRERSQMDFRLKKLRRGHCGLNIGFGPGPFLGDPMPENAIHVSEDVFWLLEPSIQRHSVQYSRPYSHYGVTEVVREEWIEILNEWNSLKINLKSAMLTPQVGILRFIPRDSRTRFVRDFDRNRIGPSRMISRLDDWMRTRLVDHEQVTVIGI